MVMMKGADGIADTADDVLVEGNPAAPISLANAVRTGHQFLIDIAHSADPYRRSRLLTATTSSAARSRAGTYDDELLNAHYIAGDGRVNENIGLTAVHSIFHSEHNRLVDQTKQVVLAEQRPRLPQPVAAARHRAGDLPDHPGADRRAAVERRAPVPGRRSSAPRCNTSTSCSRSSRAPSSRRSTNSSRRTATTPPINPVDRRRVRAHGLSLRPLDADRDGGPLRPEFQRRRRSDCIRPISSWA